MIVFNSSLPRSGSTLLQEILSQNPRFYCSTTSGLLELVYAARQSFTSVEEFKLHPSGFFDSAWMGFCRGALEGYYKGMTDKPVCVDKSRGWMAYYDWLKRFYPEAKVIVCVRDLRGIIASMEKLHRKNSHLHDLVEIPQQMKGINVNQRVQHWIVNPPVGMALNRLADAFQKGDADHFHFVRYENLVRDPKSEIDKVYKFIGEEPFTHDFDHVVQGKIENDFLHGVYGDHKVREAVSPPPDDWDEVLSRPVCKGIIASAQWYYEKFYPEVA